MVQLDISRSISNVEVTGSKCSFSAMDVRYDGMYFWLFVLTEVHVGATSSEGFLLVIKLSWSPNRRTPVRYILRMFLFVILLCFIQSNLLDPAGNFSAFQYNVGLAPNRSFATLIS